MLTFSQKGYINIILEQFGFIDTVLIRTSIAIQKLEGLTESDNLNSREEIYRCIVRSLIYLMITIRPDLASLVEIIS